MEDGWALQIVKFKNNEFELDEKLLVSVLNRREIKDRKVVVISIAGAFHEEKKFLLEFFLRYLYAQYDRKDVTDWISKGRDVTNGFSWRNGPKNDTTGIFMWSHVFMHNFGHQKKVIILLDTQGVFDNQSSAKNSTFVFTLSTLISSLQIYNLSQNSQENDLVKSARHHIKSCFSEIDCFLMPNPGLTVCEEQCFQRELGSEESKIKDQLKDLIPSLISPRKLKAKIINGQQVSARELITYLKSYVEALASEKLIRPATIMNAAAEASHILVLSQVQDLYIREMKIKRKSATNVSESDLKTKDDLLRKKCLHLFDTKKKMGSADITSKFRQKLVEGFDKLERPRNQSRVHKEETPDVKPTESYLNAKKHSMDFYDNQMNIQLSGNGSLEDDKFEEQHKRIMNIAWARFMSRKTSDGDNDMFKQYKSELYDHINSGYLRYKNLNKDNGEKAKKADDGTLMLAMKAAKQSYSVGMENYFVTKQYFEENELREIHNILEKSVLCQFKETVELNHKNVDVYYNELKSELNDVIYKSWVNRNVDKRQNYFAEIDKVNVNARMNALHYYRTLMEEYIHNMRHTFVANTRGSLSKHVQLKDISKSKYISEASNRNRSYMDNLQTLIFEMDEAYKQYMDKLKREEDIDEMNKPCSIS